AFQNVRDLQHLSDLLEVTRRAAVLHHTRPAHHLQISHLGEVGEDFVLHAIGEEGVGLVVALVFERQNGDALTRWSSRTDAWLRARRFGMIEEDEKESYSGGHNKCADRLLVSGDETCR